MVVEKLMNTLDKLLQLHENLYQVALQKTDYLKQNNVEELKELLKKEQMFAQAIKQIETERIQLSAEFLNREQDLTLSACIEKAEGKHKEKLEQVASDFSKTMDKLKAANQLNRELTHQALQFVSISLDMLMPQENITNYQRPDASNAPSDKLRRSLFDSQA
ncbi:flagellar protein FlgN [Metabacillus litoralis]|uniref:Flagellar protein FlgN n=1 Tax=Metabacillus litoralis TaxID=152268 RepID=A0A5C6W569_9BACI|nr:flagellar protein FlgN [Metabacillus litoralis]TXC90974.1 flagellar protein FlgN [Metabacillus litoralis]